MKLEGIYTCDRCGSGSWTCEQCGHDMYSFPLPDEAPTRERIWDVISRVRDAAPRLPDDATTDDIIDALVDVGLLKVASQTYVSEHVTLINPVGDIAICEKCGQDWPCDENPRASELRGEG
jgi:hypothetical protein